MGTTRVIATAMIALLAVPVALACADRYAGINNHATGERYYIPFASADAPVPEGSVWKETNGIPGWQCDATLMPDGTSIPADERIV